MSIVIATSYGVAFEETLLGGAAIFFALILALVGALFRLRWLALIAAVASLIAAMWAFQQERLWQAALVRGPGPNDSVYDLKQACSDFRGLRITAIVAVSIGAYGAFFRRRPLSQKKPE